MPRRPSVRAVASSAVGLEHPRFARERDTG